MPWFKRKAEAPSQASPEPPAVPSPPAFTTAGIMDWSDIDAVRAEWPRGGLNIEADLQAWREGVLLYERDDYASMMR